MVGFDNVCKPPLIFSVDQNCLQEEKNTAEALKKEVKKIQEGFQSREDDSSSGKSVEKELESAKSLREIYFCDFFVVIFTGS